ncbi:MAG: ABC transporter permease, partial [Rhodobacteraceae bacterium]|nr:ABC transporter permease [Paracoccaceae bacterium]
MSLGKLLERIVQLVPVLLGVSLIVFVMMALTPGDPVQIMVGEQSITPAQEAELRHSLGLDRPMAERFFIFLMNAAHFDFGTSFYHGRPVADVIAERLP